MWTPCWRLAACGALLLALTGLALQLHVAGDLAVGSDTRVALFVALACVAGLVYAGGAVTVLRHPPGRNALWLVLAVAVLLRGIVVMAPAFLSSDLYRYIWDGRVQRAGINPYLYVPADPALAGLRDAAVFPNINRADYAPTIYPPVAQFVFLAVTSISENPRAMKLAMLGFDLLAIFVLLRVLAAAGLARERVLIYAWHPLPVWEFAGNAHVDAVAIALISLAMLAQIGRKWPAAATFLAGATLVKLLPAVLLPAFWRGWNWRFLAVFGVEIVACYLCYIGAGWHVFGFLAGYTAEEGLATGGPYPMQLLNHLLPLPAIVGKIYLLLLLAVLGVLALQMIRAREEPADPVRLATRILVLTTVLTAGLSPHYPWYFCWLLPASCLVPRMSVIYLSVAVFLIYLKPFHGELFWPSLVYLPFAALAVFELSRRADPVLIGRR